MHVVLNKIRSKSHPKSLQKLSRIHDRILLSCETASDLILEGLDLNIIRVALRFLGNFCFGGETRTFVLTLKKQKNVHKLY